VGGVTFALPDLRYVQSITLIRATLEQSTTDKQRRRN